MKRISEWLDAWNVILACVLVIVAGLTPSEPLPTPFEAIIAAIVATSAVSVLARVTIGLARHIRRDG